MDVPHPLQIRRNAYPKPKSVLTLLMLRCTGQVRTLYQCFFTEPSVLLGKV